MNSVLKPGKEKERGHWFINKNPQTETLNLKNSMSVHNVNFVEYFSDQKGEKAKWPWSINKHPQKETLNLKNSMSDAEGRKLDIKFVLLLLSKVRQIWSVCCFNQYHGEKS